MSDDERILAELKQALRAAEEVPASFVAAGKAAFAWRNVDAELAELTLDSVSDAALAGTRQEPAGLRAFTFTASRLSIQVQVTTDALLGQVVPPQPGQLEVQSRDGSTQRVPVDEVGWFAVRPLPATMFRLSLRTADGTAVLTQWTAL